MMKSRQNALSALLFAALLLLLAGCPPQGLSKKDPDTKQPADVCTGEACTVDAGGDIGNVEIKSDGEDQPDEQGCTDECNLVGEIKCDGEDAYFTCTQKDGCLVWGASQDCNGQSVCSCLGFNEENTCEPTGDICTCDADCDGKECGPDGCGGSCGKCEDGSSCDPFEFTCQENSCDNCESLCEEGDTFCNGDEVLYCVNVNADNPGCVECWKPDAESEPCPGDQFCDSDVDACVCADGLPACGEACCDAGDACFGGECCTPACDGKECGSDGCGGTCGTCDEGWFCNSGTCQEDCVSDCDYPNEKQCNGDNTGYFSCDPVAGAEDCYQENGPFGCGENEACVDGECVCQPSCTGKECGGDGCGGSCGECEGFYKCNASFKCVCDCEGEPLGTMCDLDTNTEYASNCLATCAGASNLKKGPCPKCEDDCTEDELTPMNICGFDEVTYTSFCDLKCKIGDPMCQSLNNCNQVQYPGACKPDCCEDQGCQPDYNPLCGEDGVTYCNKCALQSCGEGTGLACLGACLNATACPDCTDDCEPVCGLKGIEKVTYGNACIMSCSGADLLWEGECCLQCGEFEEWVCGSDGENFKAHINDCFQNCQAPEQVNLYDIPELPNGDIWLDLCEVCKCDISSGDPVCGDDYFTYANECALACAAAAEGFDVGDVPQCPGPCFTDECPCPVQTDGLAVAGQVGGDGIRGVCGADGNTYGNECHAAKYGTFVVSQIWCSTCADTCGSDSYEPVCCDGVTYPNACVADKCNDQIDPGVVCFKGMCCKADADCDDGNEETTDTCNNGVCESI